MVSAMETGMEQAILDFEHHPAAHGLGFELGWEHARFGLAPPLEHLHAGDPLHQGWQAGRATFGERASAASPRTRQWLQLRLQAWLRGRSFEATQVTPNYLGQIEATHCPVTREALTRERALPTDSMVERVNPDAGYAAGNLAVMSRRASAAKDELAWDEALAQAASDQVASAGQGDVQRHGLDRGLSASEWMRAAVLMSFVSTLLHEQAARLPLVMLPPNRLRLLNPIQGLQVLVSCQLLTGDWSHRVKRIEDLLPGSALRRDFNLFLHGLVARMMQAGRLGHQAPDLLAQRWALEDAWADPAVRRRWQRMALQLTAAQARRLVERIGSKGLAPQRVLLHDDAIAVEGWALESRGFRPAAVAHPVPVPARGRGHGRQRSASTIAARIAALPVDESLA
jgi:hypothetical protein